MIVRSTIIIWHTVRSFTISQHPPPFIISGGYGGGGYGGGGKRLRNLTKVARE
jgi:hypothetical protein